jgi:hypothetical protein
VGLVRPDVGLVRPAIRMIKASHLPYNILRSILDGLYNVKLFCIIKDFNRPVIIVLLCCFSEPLPNS